MFSRKKHAGSSLARAGMGHNLYSYSLELALTCIFRSRPVESFPFPLKPEKFARESFAQGVSWKITGYPSFGLQLERKRKF
jgi:hypothetical protein